MGGHSEGLLRTVAGQCPLLQLQMSSPYLKAGLPASKQALVRSQTLVPPSPELCRHLGCTVTWPNILPIQALAKTQSWPSVPPSATDGDGDCDGGCGTSPRGAQFGGRGVRAGCPFIQILEPSTGFHREAGP